MSRIGKKPIPLPQGVKVEWDKVNLKVSGPLGKLSRDLSSRIILEVGAKEIQVKPQDDSRLSAAQWGLARTLVDNMVTGVSAGFTRGLELVGTGYKVENRGKSLLFTLGYSHPIDFPLPAGITAEVEKANRITLKGIDKEELGQLVANLRALRPPDAYKGKGVRRMGEVIRKKVGKAAGR
jgi:large subunit ribosomal protein L6